MGSNDHIDFELHDLVEDLVSELMLKRGTPAFGVAQQVIHQGYDSLTSKQRFVYDSVVAPLLKRLGEQHRINEIINSNPD